MILPMNSALPTSPAPVMPDRASLLAALTVTGKARTALGYVTKANPFSVRPWVCEPFDRTKGGATSHESPALAVARLVNL